MPASSILVADDDTAIRTVLNQALSRAGYEVRLTGNAATLWRWVSQGEGDLVITDVVMPGMGGRELVKQLAQTRPETKVLYLSGYTEDAIVSEGTIESGAAFLQKPFTLQNLSRKVREVLG